MDSKPVNIHAARYYAANNNQKTVERKTTQKKGAFDKKYRNNNKHERSLPKWVGTAVLMIGSAFLAYKNKNRISEFGKIIKDKAGNSTNSFVNKFPNLSQALFSLKRAAQTPVDILKEAGGKVLNAAGNLFNKA